MKKSRFFLALLFVSLSFVLMPATAKAGLWDVPVAPGESFRWVFVTSMGTDAMAPDIEYYNNFINYDVMSPWAGMSLADIAGKSTLGDVGWMAIASTLLAPNAHDNIGHSSAGIYSLQGDLVAPDTTFLFSGLLLFSPITMDKLEGFQDNQLVWTGCFQDGSPFFPLRLP